MKTVNDWAEELAECLEIIKGQRKTVKHLGASKAAKTLKLAIGDLTREVDRRRELVQQIL